MKILLVAVNSKYIHSNLAVYSLKAYAEKKGLEGITIKEYTINQQISDIVQGIYREQPDIVAFSTYIWNVEYIEKIASQLKLIMPKLIIWAGGPEVTYDAKGFLEKNVAFDGIMRGEGEETFFEVFSHINSGIELSDVCGITYRADEAIIELPERKCMNMDELPFVYETLTEFENKIIYYESSRGCPFGCSYCLSSVEKSVRFRSLSLVKAELKRFLAARVAQVKFVDRTFNCDRNRTLELLRFIADNDNGITNFHFEIAADLITDEEIGILNSLRPGLVQLEIGVQSTNTATISEIHRVMDIAKVADVVAKLNAAQNIHIHLDLIAGLPYENLDSFKKSFDDVFRMKPEQLQLGFLKVLKGSGMKLNAQSYGMVYSSLPPYEIYSTNWITYDEIMKLKKVEEIVETYYNSGQYANTIEYLCRFYDSPFEMFESIATFFEARNAFEVKHSRMDICRLLKEYASTVNGIDIELVSGLLMFDLYLRENLKSRPEFALPVDGEEKEKIRKMYISVGVPANGHIEPFLGKVINQITGSDRAEMERVYVRFDYNSRNPLNHSAEFDCM